MYTHVWSKYLPVIRILLKKSATAEQKMGLNRTDFEKGNRTRKPSCSFNVEVVKGRFSMISQSAPAKELVAVLLEDETARTLLRQNSYKITLNSDLQLTITNIPAEVETVPEAASAKEES